jgi:hypothetical protein
MIGQNVQWFVFINFVKSCYFSRRTKNAVLKTKAKHIYVATDKNPLKEDLENHLKSLKVCFHSDMILNTVYAL